ncbi:MULTISPECIES: GNAT family N-acetyltransferase [Xanthobacter]|uniref:Ribosomal-protein-alanine N-acetyltransferase n=1 Tax=Xanthobacter flavus TaxID=281 RepID=A0A9W6CTH6_XANFL|nr:MULTISPECIES: GNAT family protein [Xanthobacter]MDR6336243.1 ribosomal-protein-alanine N-acetyltransferase [Xanthobacter flavus]UDQ88100.1 GNAT family N-acetyltransferase [Xanthobacter autotrophicus]UJX45863.1 N-acetyltransferase [Xanthobacter sp. YC-JY1]GLI25012.1 ribosomal-protein-alanine N-acetyltransferase [Xanthobacter flavus]
MWLSALFPFPAEPLPAIEGKGVYLRVPQMKDFVAWRTLRDISRGFLTPWEPLWPSDDLTRGAFRRRLRRYARDMVTDEAYPLFIFRRVDDELVGGLTLSNVRRGVCQAASLGYWMGAPYAGQGYMRAAVTALLPVAHDVLHLRRVEAACMPNNQASIRLLESCGFTREGYSREYLCINGTWEDHILFARLKSDPIARLMSREETLATRLSRVPPAAQ